MFPNAVRFLPCGGVLEDHSHPASSRKSRLGKVHQPCNELFEGGGSGGASVLMCFFFDLTMRKGTQAPLFEGGRWVRRDCKKSFWFFIENGHSSNSYLIIGFNHILFH